MEEEQSGKKARVRRHLQRRLGRPPRKRHQDEEVPSEEDSEEGEDDEEAEKVMTLWTRKNMNRLNGDGWHPDGKLFHEKIKAALKEIPAEEWKDVWDEFWAEYKGKDKEVR